MVDLNVNEVCYNVTDDKAGNEPFVIILKDQITRCNEIEHDS
jgi:hypothetical protein